MRARSEEELVFIQNVRGTIELGIFLLYTANIYTYTLLSYRTPE
jgi:hypothetical protein